VKDEPRTIAIVLGRRSDDSRVFIDGVDISSSVMGVDISAHVGAVSVVTLKLSTRVEITGEAGEIIKSLG